jgi:rhamnosyl/mannosyltransferase
VIAGSGPEEMKLKKQVEDLGVKNIIFAGQVSNKEKVSLIQKCKALILPSHLRSEAYGMVLVEASMMGKPMISCEIGTGTSFVNKHEETGLVVKPENVDEMADAMRMLLEKNTLSQKLGHNARSRYENMFSGKALGKAYSAVYQELL